MKKLTILLPLLAPCCLAAQTAWLVHTVVATSGSYSEHQSSGYSLSWTLGEIATETVENGNHTLTQGFQQPFEMDEIVPAIDLDYRGLQVNVSPNPVTNILIVAFPETLRHELLLSDMFGRVLFSRKSTEIRDEIDLSMLPPGVYALGIKTDSPRPFQSCTIVKH